MKSYAKLFDGGKAYRDSVLERASNRTFEAAVDLTQKRLLPWNEVHRVQPAILPEQLLTTVWQEIQTC